MNNKKSTIDENDCRKFLSTFFILGIQVKQLQVKQRTVKELFEKYKQNIFSNKPLAEVVEYQIKSIKNTTNTDAKIWNNFINDIIRKIELLKNYNTYTSKYPLKIKSMEEEILKLKDEESQIRSSITKILIPKDYISIGEELERINYKICENKRKIENYKITLEELSNLYH